MNPMAKGQKPHGRKPQCVKHGNDKYRFVAKKCFYKPLSSKIVKKLSLWLTLVRSLCRVSEC